MVVINHLKANNIAFSCELAMDAIVYWLVISFLEMKSLFGLYFLIFVHASAYYTKPIDGTLATKEVLDKAKKNYEF